MPREERRIIVNSRFRDVERYIGRYVTNISRTGCFVRTAETRPLGAYLDLDLTLVTPDEIEIIRGRGQVVRLSEDPPGMGVAFVELNPESQFVIERLLTGRDELNLPAHDDPFEETGPIVPPPLPIA